MNFILIIAMCNFPGDYLRRCDYDETPHWTMEACVADARARSTSARVSTKARDVSLLCVPRLPQDG